LEFLSPDHKVKKATFGQGETATVVVVNERPTLAGYESRLGGSVLLPPWGFVVESPRFAAFYARRWNGRDYPAGALFTLRADGPTRLSEATRLRVFHGFGDHRIDWRGTTYDIRRESVIDVGKGVRG
jgi:hypothetical protein